MKIMKSRIQELEECLKEKNDSSSVSNKQQDKDCPVSPKGVHFTDECKTDMVENPKLKALEEENECLKKELSRLQECVQDLCRQLDTLCDQDSLNNTPDMRREKQERNSDQRKCISPADLRRSTSLDTSSKCAKLDAMECEIEKLKQEITDLKNVLEKTCQTLEVSYNFSPNRELKLILFLYSFSVQSLSY